MGQVIAVLDVGGTSIKTGVVRFEDAAAEGDGVDHRVDHRVEIGPGLPANSLASSEVILESFAAGAHAALDLAGGNASGLAIAICGPFDIDAGISRMRGVHKFEDIYGIDLRAELRKRSSVGDLPIRFARDAESAGTGEALAGAGAGVDRVLTMTVGTGLGTCLTDHAAPVEYIDGFGVEHLAMRDTPWGGRADDVLSAHGLAARLGVEMADLRAAVEDPSNAEVVADHGGRLGAFLAPVVVEFDAHLVVIGGGFSGAFDRFGPALQAAIGDVPVRPAALGPAGPLLGAAHLTFRS
jgi:predicted NBD/HSP70 family sugar kinase